MRVGTDRIWMLVLTVLVAISIGLIQKQRADTFRDICEGQNMRHDATIAKLDNIIKGLPPGPEKTRAVRNREGTVSLIKTLAPKRDCDRVVRKVVGWPWGDG